MSERRPIGLWVQAAAAQSAWLGSRLMMSYQALEVTGSTLFISIQAATFALAGLVFALRAGRIADRFGSPIVCLIGISTSIFGTFVALLVPVPAGLLAAAFLLGAGQIFLLVGQQSVAASSAVNGKSDLAFGALSAATSFGQLIGPPLTAAVASFGEVGTSQPDTTIGFLVSIVFLVIAFPAAGVLFIRERRSLGLRAERALSRSSPVPVLDVLRISGMSRSLMVSGAVVVTVDLLSSFLPLWGVERGVSATTVGLLLAVRAVFTITSRFGMARLLRTFGRKSLIVAAMIVAVIALGLLPLANEWWAIPLMALIGFGLGMPQPLTMAWVASLAPRRASGAAMGLRMSSNKLAQFSIPLAVGSITGPLGVAAVFWSTSIFLACAAALALFSEIPTDEGEAKSDSLVELSDS